MVEKKRATRADWQISPMPEQKIELKVERQVSNDEMQQLKMGFIPDDMNQRWFVYYEDNRLYFHRSWTGYCIYIIEFEPKGEEFSISRLLVNRDKTQYSNERNEIDEEIILDLLNYLTRS